MKFRKKKCCINFFFYFLKQIHLLFDYTMIMISFYISIDKKCRTCGIMIVEEYINLKLLDCFFNFFHIKLMQY